MKWWNATPSETIEPFSHEFLHSQIPREILILSKNLIYSFRDICYQIAFDHHLVTQVLAVSTFDYIVASQVKLLASAAFPKS